MRNNRFRFFTAVVLMACGGLSAFAYDLIYGQSGARVTWNSGSIPFVIRMSQTENLQDGTSFASSVQAAMETWNAQVTNVQFSSAVAVPGLATDGDGINEIAFDTKIYSNSTDPDNPPQEFGENTLAVTLSWTTTSARADGTYQRTQSDILFNSDPKWNWNSYRGNLQPPEDIRRVAIHELGHVLGLDHPDQDGQTVTAIMNAYVSNIDSLQTDDLTGAQLLYGRPGGYSAPSNDNFANATTITLSGTSANLTGSSVGAGKESGEPHHGHDNDGASIWWKWTATSNGTLTINTLGSNFDTVLAAYTGGAVNSLTQLAANDDTSDTERRSTITITVSSGTTYSIAAAGWDAQWGEVRMSLNFTAAVGPPLIIQQPNSVAVATGSAAQFSIGISAGTTYTLRWEMAAPGSGSWTAIGLQTPAFSGADSSVLTVAGSEVENYGGYSFRCVATNSAGSVTSNSATLSLASAAPLFTRRPLSVQTLTGSALTVSAEVSGTGPMTYVWRRNGVVIPNAAGASLTIAAVSNSDIGWYDLTVSNGAGSARGVFRVNVTRPRSTPVAWGNAENSHTQVPAGMGAIGAVSAGGGHVLALKNDGTVSGWGSGYYHQLAIPANLTGVVQVAAGANHSLALKADGTVVGWGDSPWELVGPAATVPDNLQNVVAVSACGGRSLALRANGTVASWGWLTGDPQPMNLNDVVAIAAGPFHALALRADGAVVGWGENWHSEATPPAGLTGVVAIAAGGSASGGHSLALKRDGTVVAWGYNVYGQCSVPAGLSNVVAIAAGGHFSLAQKADGTIVAWGDNSSGQLNVPSHSLQGVSPGFDFVAGLAVAETPSVVLSTTAQAINVGDGVQLSVSVLGLGPFTFQWKRNGVVISNGNGFSGVTTNTLIITDATLGMSGTYTVEVTSAAGTFASSGITLIVGTPTGLTTRPLSRLLEEGQGVNFYVQATGAGPFTYVWRHNRRPITGATGPTLSLTNVRTADGGIYEVVITGPDGGVARSVFMLRVAVSSPTLRGWGEYPPTGNTTINYDGSLAGIWGGGNSANAALALRGDGHVVELGGPIGSLVPPNELSDAVGVALGGSHGAAVRSDGTVQCWGDNAAGQTAVPAGLRNVVAVSACLNHTVALKSDGTLVGWGASSYGQHLIPPRLRNVIAVETGRFDTTALLADGTVMQWGMHASSGWSPPNAVDIVAIAAGESHTLGLKADGTVMAWGADYAGSTVVPSGLTKVVAIAAGQAHSIALKDDGTVVGWGRNYENEAIPPAGITTAFGVAAHGWWSVALNRPTLPVIRQQPTSQGVLLGSDCTLQVVVESTSPVTYQWRKDHVPIPGATGASLILAGIQPSDFGGYDVVITNGMGSTTSQPAVVSLALPPVVTAQPNGAMVYAGESASFAVGVTSNAPVQYQWRRDGAQIEGAVSASYQIAHAALADVGTYTVMVSNIAGNVVSAGAILTILPSSTPIITQQPQSKAVALAARTSFSVVATGGPTPSYRWQRLPAGTATWIDVVPGLSQFYTGEATPTLLLNVGTLLGNHGDRFRCIVSNIAGTVTSDEATLTVVSSAGALRVAAGDSMTLLARIDGRPWATGANFAGQLGDGTTGSKLVPTQLGTFSDVVDVAAGFEHSFFLRADGTLWAAGDNQLGQLGDGTTIARVTPAPIATSVASSAGGYRHSLFRKTDGTLWAMGFNSSGQLGDGTSVARSTPVQIAAEVTAMSAGYAHSLFVKTDGTAWATGSNAFGQFGDGTTTARSTPVQVATNVKDVAGFYHTLFLKRDGTLWAAGRNDSGQLGDGSTISRATPVQVASGVVAIAAGALHSVYLKADGTAWTMGLNSGGQLGDGTTTSRTAPVQVASNVAAIGTGTLQTFLVKSDGTLWAAGRNSSGQLGDGTITDRPTFVQVASGGSGLPADYTHPTATNSASATRLAVSWPHSRGALYYRVWRHTANNAAAATLLADRVVGNFYADLTAAPGVSYYYWVQPVNQFGELSVGASALGRWGTAGAAPVITTAPASQTVAVGANLSFSVGVTGTSPLNFQWRKDGQVIPNATGASYGIGHAQVADAGSYDVIVSNGFGSVTSASATLTVNQLGQTIDFAPPTSVGFTTAPVALSASASSGLPVTFSVVSGPGSFGSGSSSLVLTDVGTLVVRVTQAGNGTYAAAAPLERSIEIVPGAVAVTFWDQSLTRIYNGSDFPPTALTTPSVPVTLTYNGSATAPRNAGSYTVVATVSDARYTGSATATYTIEKATQIIALGSLPDREYPSSPFSLFASSTSGQAVTFSVVSGPATVNGDTVTLTGTGTVVIRASQSGNQNYLAAPAVERSFSVTTNFEAWSRAHFTSLEMIDATISGPTADPDGDSFVNLVEYALGTDPRVDSAANAPVMAAADGAWTFTYTRPADRPDVTYTVEFSTNLTTWSTTGVTHTRVSVSGGGVETWRANYPLNSAPCFFRLAVFRP